MATDLKNVNDHPAALLGSMQLGQSAGAVNAAYLLRRYEQNHSITFAALDNDTLEEVARLSLLLSFTPNLPQEVRDFNSAVTDLLGLAD